MQETTTIKTCYGPITTKVLESARIVRLLICDVDGVMSDGLIYMDNHGEELKTFNIRDGYGIHCLLTLDIEVAIITGRSDRLLEKRCATLGITHLYQGCSNKIVAFRAILTKLKLVAEQVAYIGDDLTDATVMDQVGLSVAVADAHPLLRSRADYITHMGGGRGAVREVCDLLLLAQGKLKISIEHLV